MDEGVTTMRRPMKRSLLWLVVFFTASLPHAAEAALNPREVDDYNGKEAPAFVLETLKGEKVALAQWKGHPVVLSYFASWCPPCRAEVGALMKLHEEFAARGLVIVGAAGDRHMIPDTDPADERKDVTEFVEEVKVPYPVSIATDALVADYKLEGIPITVFIGKDGKIAKTLHGLHDLKRLEAIARTLVPDAAPEAGPQVAGAAAPPARSEHPRRSGLAALLEPFHGIVTATPRQWHPSIVHFPIALLVLEAALVFLFWLKKSAHLERAAYYALHLSVWALLVTAITGVRDSGLDLGAGEPLLLGFRDRVANLWKLESSITVHAWLAIAVLVLALVRLLWRSCAGPQALAGARGAGYGVLTLLGLWCLVAAGYAGGIITHS